MVFEVGVETVGDLRRLLRDSGYSERAVEEILKWYTPND